MIYDPDKIISELKRKIPKCKPSFIGPSLYLMKGINLDRKWPKEGLKKFLYRKNYLQINKEFDEAFQDYLTVLYAINNKYFVYYNHSRVTIKKLKYKPKNCWNRLQRTAKLGNDFKSLRKKVKMFQSLYNDLLKIIKLRKVKYIY